MNGDFTYIQLTEIGSTNDYAKDRRGEGLPLIVSAKRQTGGRGTKGRSFSSEAGGVYLSRLQFPHISVARAFEIMIGAAVAVCETLTAYGLSPCIKWPNDIHVHAKKIAGILIENTLSGGEIVSSVTGIGLNVHNLLPAELDTVATTMEKESGRRLSTSEVETRLIAELFKVRSIEDYRRYLGYVGREITLLLGDERVPATLVGVDNVGNLQVKTAGELKTIPAGEVSVRI